MSSPLGPDAGARLAADLRATLLAYDPPDAGQQSMRSEFLAHLEAHPDAVFREGPPAHFTASLLVVDAAGDQMSQVLLTHHRKAHMWVQFGGHLEPGDRSVADAAAREGREESGIDSLGLTGGLVELDRHELHGDFVRCTHHLDVRYVAVAPAGVRYVTSDESFDVAWWSVDALPEAASPDLPRFVEHARRATAGR